METSHDKIAKKAYYKYLEKGSKNGEDLNDWLEAEKEVKKKSVAKKPAKSTKTATAVKKSAKSKNPATTGKKTSKKATSAKAKK